jgi:hypothetical protein
MISSLENIYQKMSAGETGAAPKASPVARECIGGDVAHDLNNILTIIRGYAERVILKHGENAALRPDMQVIFDNARRAENVVRQAIQATRRGT